jgi:bifunctional non-homologous end joining protein LigD
VATPLEWDELDDRRIRADRFTIRDVPKRLAGQPDPWAALALPAWRAGKDPMRWASACGRFAMRCRAGVAG